MREERKDIRGMWARGAPALGAWSMLPCPNVMEVTARAGFDFVCIDLQHGLASEESVIGLLRSLDLTGAFPFVRVGWNRPDAIGRVLDAGAMGVIVPMVNSAQAAAQAVASCRYAPTGARSFGPMRVAMREGADYYPAANEAIVMAVMVETREALDNLDAIAATSGVDVIFLGPFDLSVSLGLPPGDNDGEPSFDDALHAVVDACRRHGKVAGVLSNKDRAAERIAQGFQFVSVTMDVGALSAGLAMDLDAVKSALSASERGE